ncbi:hypothetical protein D9M71_455360 [compost metagenome]
MVDPPEKYSKALWVNRSQANCTAYSNSVTGQEVRKRTAVNRHSTMEQPRVMHSASQGSGSSSVQ